MNKIIHYAIDIKLEEAGYGDLTHRGWVIKDEPTDEVIVYGTLSSESLITKVKQLKVFDNNEREDLCLVIERKEILLHRSLTAGTPDTVYKLTEVGGYTNAQQSLLNGCTKHQQRLLKWLVTAIHEELEAICANLMEELRMVYRCYPKGSQQLFTFDTPQLSVRVNMTFHGQPQEVELVNAALTYISSETKQKMLKAALFGTLLYGSLEVSVFKKNDATRPVVHLVSNCVALYETPSGRWEGMAAIVKNLLNEKRQDVRKILSRSTKDTKSRQ